MHGLTAGGDAERLFPMLMTWFVKISRLYQASSYTNQEIPFDYLIICLTIILVGYYGYGSISIGVQT